MLENVRQLLDQGKPDIARSALRESLLQFCSAAFSSGTLRHPLLAPKTSPLRRELADLAGALLGGEAQGRPVVLALDFVERSIQKKAVTDETLDHLNFALQLLLPDLALILDEALENGRFKLGAAASNVEDPLSSVVNESLMRPELKILVALANEGMRAMEGGRLDRLQALSLRDLDVSEEGPLILGLKDDHLALECPGCAQRLTTPLGSIGKDIRCGCSTPIKVTRPSLERMAAYLKAARQARLGIARCRVCHGVIQVSRNVFMRAGFCSAVCAKQGRELFQEHVAPEGLREGEEVRFRCHCGASITAPIPESPEKVACLSCSLDVWIPLPAAGNDRERPKALLTCACGRPIKSTARTCLYCGAPPPSP
ncbi:MAG TPA: hypothetical protein VKW04_03905 [Planctomycetota bacterium]|nr:hypothetical protein [Planctomycetota bacterium]